MISFQIHNASNRFWSNGAVRMRGLLNPINFEGTSTVGNLGHASSQSQERAERGLRRVICGRSPFISARQGLRESEGSIATQHPVQSLPVPFEPVLLQSSQARELRKPVERFTEVTLRAFAFSSIVICMRELASVLLLRLSQFPRSGHGPNEFLGAFLKAPRSLTRPRTKFLQEPMRGPLVTFRPLPVLVLVHDKKRINGAQKCQTKEFPKTEKEFPRTP